MRATTLSVSTAATVPFTSHRQLAIEPARGSVASGGGLFGRIRLQQTADPESQAEGPDPNLGLQSRPAPGVGVHGDCGRSGGRQGFVGESRPESARYSALLAAAR